MRAQGVSFRHAVELLRAGGAPVITPGRRRRCHPIAVSQAARRPRRSVEAEACSPRWSTTTTPPWSSPPRRWPIWPAGRSTTPRRSSRFRLGYANRTLGYRLPSKQTKEGDAVRGRLTHLGVLRASGHEHLTGSLVVPVVTLPARSPSSTAESSADDLRGGHALPPLPARPAPGRVERGGPGRWRGDPVRVAHRRAHLLVLSASPHVTAAYGTAGFTADHAEAFDASTG